MKNILIYFPDSLVPLTMANRIRINEKIKFLSRNHSVTFLSLIDTLNQKDETLKLVNGCCKCEFIFRPAKKRMKGFLLRTKWKLYDYFGIFPYDYSLCNGDWHKRAVRKAIPDLDKYDCIICDYWYGASSIFNYLKNTHTKKIVDTHNVLSDQRALDVVRFYKVFSSVKWINKYRQLEKESLAKADTIFAVSKSDYDYYKVNYSDKHVIFIPFGIDVSKFSDFSLESDSNTILSYGNLGDDQNILAFDRLWDNILPLIKKEKPDTQLLVVGNNPTEKMKEINKLDYVNVTGYVKNPLEFLCKAKVHIVATETASGFRGRVPEVMGMGIPTIGTHNALDCIGLQGELAELVTDDDGEIAALAISLMSDKAYWTRISGQSKKFILENYSAQKTYSNLEVYI